MEIIEIVVDELPKSCKECNRWKNGVCELPRNHGKIYGIEKRYEKSRHPQCLLSVHESKVSCVENNNDGPKATQIKEYIIFLDSGEVIEGEAENAVLEELSNEWIHKAEGMRMSNIYTFEDVDGMSMVNLSKIQAICINKKHIPNKLGY